MASKTPLFVLLLLLAAPIATAAFGTQTYTSDFGALSVTEKDYVQWPIDSEGAASPAFACPSSTIAVSLTAGSTYYFFMSYGGSSTATNYINASGLNLATIEIGAGGPYVNITDATWTVKLLWWQTAQTMMMVKLIPGANANVVTACSGSGSRQGLTYDTTVTNPHYQMPLNFYTYLCSSTCTGFVATQFGAVFNGSSQLSEAAILATELQYSSASSFTCSNTAAAGSFSNALPINFGGNSFYYAVREFYNQSTGIDYSLSTTLGGPAVHVASLFAASGSPSYAVDLWRISYEASHWNSSVSDTFTQVGPTGTNTINYCILEPASVGSAKHVGYKANNLGNSLITYSPTNNMMFWSSDDYNLSEQITAYKCNPSDCSGFDGTTPLVNTSIIFTQGTSTGRTLASCTTNSAGVCSVYGQALIGQNAIITVAPPGNTYFHQTWSVSFPANGGSFQNTVGAPLLTSATTTSPITGTSCTPSSATFTVPAAANITINLTDNNPRNFAVAKMISNNPVVTQSPLGLIPVGQYNYAFTYPFLGYSQNSTTRDDRGAYALLVMNDTNSIQLVCPFVITDTTIIFTQFPVTAGFNASLQQQINATSTVVSVSGQTSSSAANSESIIQLATDSAFRQDILIPNMYWLPIILAIAGLVIAAMRSRGA